MNLNLIIRIPILLLISITAEGDVTKLADSLIGIQAKGKGNDKAVQSWKEVSKLSVSAIPKLLHAMNQANNLGDNWIRSAIAEILDHDHSIYPEKEIQDFLKSKKNTGSSRKLAFEIIEDQNPQLAQSLISHFLNDPEPSLRRLAISKLLETARNSKHTKEAKILYQKVLANSCEVDQIIEASQALENAGEKIDIQSLMGFLTEWHTMGPYDNTERKGFNTPYKPEMMIDSSIDYHEKDEKPKWISLTTEDPFGMLNINSQYGEIKEVLAYAHTTFNSESNRAAQFRIGSKNAWKLWLNGKLLFARDEYHRGKTRVDQFVINGKLKKGENQILVKVCQNEQTQSWTKQWEFCLRITDPTGTAIHPDPKLSFLWPKQAIFYDHQNKTK